MPAAPSVVVLSGSLRADSYNRRLARFAADRLRAAGAAVQWIDLREYRLPLYDADLDGEDRPADVFALKRLFREADGMLIASPEYNHSYTAALKNVIDWVSRPAPDEPRMAGFKGKVAGLCSAAPGRFGGVRGLRHLADILVGMGTWVVPQTVNVPDARAAFDEETLTDESRIASMQSMIDLLLRTIRAHASLAAPGTEG